MGPLQPPAHRGGPAPHPRRRGCRVLGDRGVPGCMGRAARAARRTRAGGCRAGGDRARGREHRDAPRVGGARSGRGVPTAGGARLRDGRPLGMPVRAGDRRRHRSARPGGGGVRCALRPCGRSRSAGRPRVGAEHDEHLRHAHRAADRPRRRSGQRRAVRRLVALHAIDQRPRPPPGDPRREGGRHPVERRHRGRTARRLLHRLPGEPGAARRRASSRSSRSSASSTPRGRGRRSVWRCARQSCGPARSTGPRR